MHIVRVMVSGIIVAALLSASGLAAQEPEGAVAHDGPTMEQAMDAALMPLPADLRVEAGVMRIVDYRMESVRDTQNGLYCSLDDPSDDQFIVDCYHEEFWPAVLESRRVRADLRSRMSMREANSQTDAHIHGLLENGDLFIPDWPTAGYRMYGPLHAYDWDTGAFGPEISKWQEVHVPFRTAEEMGFSTVRGQHSEEGLPGLMPWVVFPGTWAASIRIMHAHW